MPPVGGKKADKKGNREREERSEGKRFRSKREEGDARRCEGEN